MIGITWPERTVGKRGDAIAECLRTKRRGRTVQGEDEGTEEVPVGWVASTALALAKQAPGILGICVVVWLNSHIMQAQSNMAEQILRVQTVELKAALERNTEAFLKVHEHFEEMTRVLGRKP